MGQFLLSFLVIFWADVWPIVFEIFSVSEL